MSHKKDVYIFQKTSMLRLISTSFGPSVNFQHNPYLLEMAMKVWQPKVLKVKPPRGLSSLLGASSF
jgi:hypothetical protein